MKLENFKTKKMIVGIIVLVLALLLIFYGMFAFFTDSDKKQTNSQVGNLNVVVNSLQLSNPNNISPGDHDISLSDGHRPGLEHLLTFNVQNNGNKSIVTRHVIDLYIDESNANNVDMEQFFLLDNSNVELNEKHYLVYNTSTQQTEVKKDINELGSNKLVGLRYIVNSDSYNGVGSNAEVEEENHEKTSSEFTYKLGLKKEANKETVKELSNISIDVKVEAMQYKNTSDNDWNVVFEDTIDLK